MRNDEVIGAMNVIIVNDFAYINGGAGMVAINTAKLLAEHGHKVILFTAVGPIDSDLIHRNNLKVICLNQCDILNDPNRLRAVVQGIWNKKAEKFMKKILNGMSPADTIIHIHTLSKAISSSIIPAIKQKEFKIVYHVHDYGVVCPNMGFFNYRLNKMCSQKAMSWKCIFSNCDSRCYAHKIWRVIRQKIQNIYLTKNVDGFIFVSEFSKKILKSYIADGAVISNPLLTNKKKFIDVVQNKCALYIGRLSKEKNPLLLAQAAKQLNIPVIFVGDGECRRNIRDINPNAIITGWLNRDDMWKYISEARYLVFPSILYETQGMVVGEMASYGIPAIVSDSSAATDFVIDEKNGLWFKNANLESLKTAMRRLEDNEFLATLSKASYEKLEFSQEAYINCIERYYETILRQ